MTGFCTSARFLEHQPGPEHPERPDRLRAIFAAVRDTGMIKSPNPLSDEGLHWHREIPNAPQLVELEPYEASEHWLGTVHPPRHLERVRLRSLTGGWLDDIGETVVSPGSYEIAKLAVGAGMRCVDAVMNGEVRRAFAAVRPPGHHALPNQAMGFCIFSNLAIAAMYARIHYHVGKVAIVDFDVHHGNGTQAVFEADPNVLAVSLHADPHDLYPNSGFSWEIGAGEGRGATLNIPIHEGAGDEVYLKVINNQVLPKLEEFAPDLLLLAAGFDAHRSDPIGNMHVSGDGFYEMTRLLVQAAEKYCGGKVVSMLEGGYDLRALGGCVIKHLMAME